MAKETETAKDYITTGEDFELFVEEAEKWINVFGLSEYEVRFKHADGELEGSRAWCGAQANDGMATLALEKNWGESDENSSIEIKKSAFHEVIELLLAEICMLAESRFVTPNELERARHRIISRLINTIWAGSFEEDDEEDEEPKKKAGGKKK